MKKPYWNRLECSAMNNFKISHVNLTNMAYHPLIGSYLKSFIIIDYFAEITRSFEVGWLRVISCKKWAEITKEKSNTCEYLQLNYCSRISVWNQFLCLWWQVFRDVNNDNYKRRELFLKLFEVFFIFFKC